MSSPTNLAVPRKEAEEKIRARIVLGEQLLGRGINSEDELQDVANASSRWSAYNYEVLLRLFSDSRMADEYGGHDLIGASIENSSLYEAINQLTGYIYRETELLKSFLERLELMPEPAVRIGPSSLPDTPQPSIPEKAQDARNVFVVHGRNLEARNSLFRFLRSIGLRPLEWSQAVKETGKASPFIGEILDAAFSKAQAVVVLMTPDDVAHLQEPFRSPNDPPYESQPTGQARPNVLFEAGMAIGRNPDRTVIVELGIVRPFSDIAGRHTIKLSNDTRARQELAQRLETAGCVVDLSGRDWHTEGDFNPHAQNSSPSYSTSHRNDAAEVIAEAESSTDKAMFDTHDGVIEDGGRPPSIPPPPDLNEIDTKIITAIIQFLIERGESTRFTDEEFSESKQGRIFPGSIIDTSLNKLLALGYLSKVDWVIRLLDWPLNWFRRGQISKYHYLTDLAVRRLVPYFNPDFEPTLKRALAAIRRAGSPVWEQQIQTSLKLEPISFEFVRIALISKKYISRHYNAKERQSVLFLTEEGAEEADKHIKLLREQHQSAPPETP